MLRFAKWFGRFSMASSIGLLGLYSCSYVVDGGQKCVLWDMGKGVKEQSYGEGLNFFIPFYQTPYIFDIRTRPRLITTKTGSKDLQNVNISLRVLFRPNPDKLPLIFQNLGQDYDERVLPSIGNEVMKSVVAKYDVEELITKRESVSNEIRKDLSDKAKSFHIIFEDISITHLGFSKDFMQAVEAKQVAQQEAERQKWVVLKAEQERLAAVIKAEGESEAASLIAKALQAGAGLIEMRKIQASKDIAMILSQSPNVSYIPKEMNMLLQQPYSSPMTQISKAASVSNGS